MFGRSIPPANWYRSFARGGGLFAFEKREDVRELSVHGSACGVECVELNRDRFRVPCAPDSIICTLDVSLEVGNRGTGANMSAVEFERLLGVSGVNEAYQLCSLLPQRALCGGVKVAFGLYERLRAENRAMGKIEIVAEASKGSL